MAFNKTEINTLLVNCKRRCCVCLKFCGVNIEIHHIHQKAFNGEDSIENAIPLCFECHAEVNHYNVNHPRGRKYTEQELKMHKDNWISICKNNPEILVTAPRKKDIGPLESMLLELEYNLKSLEFKETGPASLRIPGILKDKEYERTVKEGFINLLNDIAKEAILQAYISISKVNSNIQSHMNVRPEGDAYGKSTNRILEIIRMEKASILNGYNELTRFLMIEN